MSQCPATIEPEDVGLLRCWRQAGHDGPHISTDGVRWKSTETAPSARQSDASAPSGPRQPANLSDDYPPYPSAPKVAQ